MGYYNDHKDEKCIREMIGDKLVDRIPNAKELVDELAAMPTIADLVNDKYIKITEAYQQDDRIVFADYNEEQQKTFYKQEHEARAWLADDKNQTPFIDGMVSVGWRTKEDLVVRIIAKSDLLAAIYGALLEKYQYLIEQLVDININGDTETEQAKIDLIVW